MSSCTSPPSSAPDESLNEGQQIEFEIEDNRGKSSAVNLRASR